MLWTAGNMQLEVGEDGLWLDEAQKTDAHARGEWRGPQYESRKTTVRTSQVKQLKTAVHHWRETQSDQQLRWKREEKKKKRDGPNEDTANETHPVYCQATKSEITKPGVSSGPSFCSDHVVNNDLQMSHDCKNHFRVSKRAGAETNTRDCTSNLLCCVTV